MFDKTLSLHNVNVKRTMSDYLIQTENSYFQMQYLFLRWIRKYYFDNLLRRHWFWNENFVFNMYNVIFLFLLFNEGGLLSALFKHCQDNVMPFYYINSISKEISLLVVISDCSKYSSSFSLYFCSKNESGHQTRINTYNNDVHAI